MLGEGARCGVLYLWERGTGETVSGGGRVWASSVFDVELVCGGEMLWDVVFLFSKEEEEGQGWEMLYLFKGISFGLVI
jgi:hypothetical protein